MFIALLIAGSQALQTPKPPDVVTTWHWKVEREWVAGDGPVVMAGDRVTVNFIARSPSGREVANTMRRGLTYTFIASPTGDAIGAALIGMHETGEREISANIDPPGVPPIVSSDEPLRIWIKIEKLTPRPGPAEARREPSRRERPALAAGPPARGSKDSRGPSRSGG